MPTTTELRQKQQELITRMSEVVRKADEARAKGESATDYDAEFDRIEAEERLLGNQIKQTEFLERQAKQEAEKALEDMDKRGEKQSGSKETEYRDAFRNYMAHGINALDNEQRAMLQGRFTRDNEQRAQTTTTGSSGGYLIPEEFSKMMDAALKDYSGVMQVATIVETSTGAPFPIITYDGTARKATIVAENTQSTPTDFAFGQKIMNAYTYRDMGAAPLELIQDSYWDINKWIPEQFAESLGRALNEDFTVGTNTGEPNGIVTASTLGKTAASATAFTRAEVVDLLHQVDASYRQSRSCGFMMNDAVLAAIKKLSFGSGDDRPLWQPSVREGAPDRLEGFPYWVNNDMASALTTGQKVMLFGDFSKYVIRRVRGMFIRRLEERFIDYGQVGFIAFARYDGDLINTAAVKHLILA